MKSLKENRFLYRAFVHYYCNCETNNIKIEVYVFNKDTK
jgi:hypothetical protein